MFSYLTHQCDIKILQYTIWVGWVKNHYKICPCWLRICICLLTNVIIYNLGLVQTWIVGIRWVIGVCEHPKTWRYSVRVTLYPCDLQYIYNPAYYYSIWSQCFPYAWVLWSVYFHSSFCVDFALFYSFVIVHNEYVFI